ncbi:MAG TPA: cobalamin biosynthesis protein CbiD [Peptococcaceae bacterium]|nr:MAG: Putative cobalt-precorrin-6A synthase [Moorella sp. 60_41]HBT47335.1 cobalamin biosynthesis protein CbiD [Peptococcaceae bacterium]
MDAKLKKGYTTGTCAAAAARAAVQALLWPDQIEDRVRITLPRGEVLELPVTVQRGEGWAEATVIKDAGDDPDITHGVAVQVRARPGGRGITLKAGRGVGRVTLPGLAVPVGEPAINPVPRAMICAAVRDFIPADKGVELTISIPGGEELARRTFNPQLGIEGGLSVLGTTGIVEPMSEEALRVSLLPQIDVARALGYTALVLTPGRRGRSQAVEGYGLPVRAVVLSGNYIGDLLLACAERRVKKVLLWGHVGKLVKVAGGIFNTQSRTADARREIVASWAAAWGLPAEGVRAVLSANTLEVVVQVLRGFWEERRCREFWDYLASLASRRSRELTGGVLEVGTAFLNLAGGVVGVDEEGTRIMEELRHAG